MTVLDALFRLVRPGHFLRLLLHQPAANAAAARRRLGAQVVVVVATDQVIGRTGEPDVSVTRLAARAHAVLRHRTTPVRRVRLLLILTLVRRARCIAHGASPAGYAAR